jgi:hypothetical protein
MIDALNAFQRVLSVLDRLEIPYYVCGSLASANYGFPRQTNDIDIVANFDGIDLKEFCTLLLPDFYVDPDRAEEAVQLGRSFNAIHRKSIFKFDFFPSPKTDFGRIQLLRRRFDFSEMPGFEGVEFSICTAEDSILSKLSWFMQGGGVSDQQWKDILAMIMVQKPSLDMDYLKKWARRLGLEELLEKAINHALP